VVVFANNFQGKIASTFLGITKVSKSCSYNICVDFSLRKLRSGDFETLWEIDQKCFPPGISYSRQELASYIRRWSAFTVVAEQKASRGAEAPKIVGFIVAEMNRKNIGHIITIDVLPEVRKKGIGSRLLIEAENRLREAKCDVVILEAAVDNHAALTFYEKHEYFAFKTIPRYYPNGVNAYVLRKDLLSKAQAS
jgi:[ribosomal protein S18]-alanine N-acetyltransferase